MRDKLRVLVLEDDPDMRAMLSGVLDAEGFQVHSASRGLEALELAREHQFDLMIADVRMEGMDGLEVLHHVKADQPETRSLVITGYSTEADSIRAIRLGVGDYLKKPFELEEFLQAVNRLVRERREQAQRQQHEQAMRRTALWALRGLASTLDRSAAPERPSGGIAATATLAGSLGFELGLGEAACEEIELAVLAILLRRWAGGGLAEVPLAPAVEQILLHVAEPWENPGCPLEARVAATALAAGELGRVSLEACPEVARELAERWPGRFDPTVLQGR
ncbi:MAG: response regulator, partial [Candidatus Eremiobacterota bacterium]